MFIFMIADFINPSSHIVVLGYNYLSVPWYILKSSQGCMIFNIVNTVHVLTMMVIVLSLSTERTVWSDNTYEYL